ncbi:hypothetical protein OROHE_001475 [Orobanche hederae]
MSSSTTEVCFNSNCKEASENWRRGWRRRTGDYAHLCDRCAVAYEDGKFCETFHLNASGWRCCESCGKQVHCGCIVSFHMFVLLDAGGIECLTCAKRSYILTPNPAWPPPLHFLPSQPERMKDHSVKTWSSIAGSGPVPWRQAPSLFNGSDIQSSVQLRTPFEIVVSGGTNRNHVCDRLSTTLPEMKREHSYERLINEKLRIGPSETLKNGNTGHDVTEQPCPFVNDIKAVFPKIDSSSTLNLAMASSSRIETDNAQLASVLSEPTAISILVGKPLCSRGGMGSCGEPQICNGKPRGDGRGRNQLDSRYRPQMTDEELQQISVVYFPQITQPEGLPLKVQDMKGKEWIFQFRFWPNNNSRMYILEGITPCIQSMQLQAGDVVTFSRLEPEGKLVMGCRKNSPISSSDQRNEVSIAGSDASNVWDGSGNKHEDFISVNGHIKEKMLEDKPSHSKRKNSSFCAKNKRLRIENEDVMELKLTWEKAQGLMRPPAKIVPSIFVVEGCEFEEFEVRYWRPFWKYGRAGGLLDYETVDYGKDDMYNQREDAPVLGRPTLPGVDHFGAKTQWVQCEDCFKWRKVPIHALLSSRWICSENVWDLDRSQCSSDEELTKEQLERMLPTTIRDSSEKEETAGRNSDHFVAVEGLETVPNLGINRESEGPLASSGNSTKHPRHKLGCACIVCLQPPSGKGSKHEQSCDCFVCGCLKRRFKTLMERRERKVLGKEAETSSQSFQPGPQLPERTHDLNNNGLNQEEVSEVGCLDEPNGGKSSSTLLKGQIDLNMQLDREEELSPGSGSGGPMKCSLERYLRRICGL